MASPPLIHARYICSCSSPNFHHIRNFSTGGTSSSSSSSSSSPSSYSSSLPSSSSFDRHQHVFFSNFCNFSGLGTFYKNSSLRVQAMSTQGNVTSPQRIKKFKDGPDHLLVLVHGILGSPSDWTYVEAELKRRLGSNFFIYASSSNTYTKTFNGIDGAGRRLADEVNEVVQKTESLEKISFLAHSLGGLFARYAVALLYTPNALIGTQANELPGPRDKNPESSTSPSKQGTIAGLEPINFITLATPHLGVRGKKQLPFLFGVPFLEKLVPSIAPILVGRTGRQLFLTDGKPSKPPLLLRMASDCEDGQFISSLGAFKSRTLYANVSYDRILSLYSLMISILSSSLFMSLGECILTTLILDSAQNQISLTSDRHGWLAHIVNKERSRTCTGDLVNSVSKIHPLSNIRCHYLTKLDRLV